MEEPDWRVLAEELTKHEGLLRVASILRRAYAKTVEGVIAEFDQFATDQKKAQDFVNNLYKFWWGITGPANAYYDVRMEDWDRVMEHIDRRYPRIKRPDWFESMAHRSALAGKDPQGKRFDHR